MSTTLAVLFVLAATCNCVAAFLNLRAKRRTIREFEAHEKTFYALLGFAAFMSRPESGAPEPIRQLAIEALPPGTSVLIDFPSSTEIRH